MLVGVIAFSFATGSLSSIMNQFDNQSEAFKENMRQLETIRQEYFIGSGLYEEIKQLLRYEAEKDKSNVHSFMKKLP